MKTKRNILKMVLAVALVCTVVLLSACSGITYGDTYKKLSELKTALTEAGASYLFPHVPEEAGEQNRYIATANPDTGELLGYRIYQFGAPFFTCVYAYPTTSETVLSEKSELLTKKEPLSTKQFAVAVYEGKLHEDTLYLIGIFDHMGKHYEVRVTADNEIKSGQYVNAIFENNDNYQKARDTIVAIVEGLTE